MKLATSFAPAFALIAVCLAVCTTCPASVARADESEVARSVHRKGGYPADLLVVPPSGSTTSAREGIPVFGERRDHARPPAREPLDTSVIDRILRWLSELFGEVRLGPVWIQLVFAIGLLLLVAAIGYLLTRLRLRLSVDDAEAKRDDGARFHARAIDPLLAVPELSPEELRARGRYREAVHALFVKSLFTIGYQPTGRARSRTAREIVSAIDPSDPRKAPVDALLSLTEIVWFGGRDATEETYARAHALLLTLEEPRR